MIPRPRARVWIFAFLGLLLAAPARADSPFSTPYDPDFDNQKAPEVFIEAPTKTPPATEQAVAAPAVPSTAAPAGEIPALLVPAAGEPGPLGAAGPFLLLDREDPAHIFSREGGAAAPAPVEFSEFEKSLPSWSADQTRWNTMRSDYEGGTLPLEEPQIQAAPAGVGVLAATEAPKALPPQVEVPSYGASLSVSGRKVIGVQYNEKRFLHDQATSGLPKTTNLISVVQQLQLRMQGRVGPRIGVNIDYDDTKPNKQDISVVYTGDPNEVVQNASFGDIDLSLPATEFVSYSKQVFGIRADIKHKGFKGSLIGSRTKGTTKTKEFIGNTAFNAIDIADNAYIRHQYYDLSFGNAARLPLQTGSERIFLAQQNVQTANSNAVTLTVDDLAVASSTFTGTFTQLAPGVDYIVDYIKGIVTFRNFTQPQFVIAVDFIDATGHHIVNESTTAFSAGTGLLKLIKTAGDVPISLSSAATQEVGFNRELKTVYSIGQSQIVRDNGQGNFFLRVIDPHTRAEVGSGLNPIQHYPDTIQVDFENGTFRLLQPFGVSVSTPSPDPDLYSPTPISKRLIHVEYHFRLKTFTLEPNIVLQSETVLVDGVKMVRNVDYFIDYDSGFITFFNENRILPTSVVDITYEAGLLGGISSESILGARASYDFNKHFSAGSTILYDSNAKAPTAPQVTDLARSLLVYDADSQIKDVWLLSNLKSTIRMEVAQSRLNPNLNGNAIVDNMEGIKQETTAGLLTPQWQIASNPTQGPADGLSQTLSNEDVPVLSVNPNAQARPSDTEKALDLNYDFTHNGSTETSIVYVFSPTGLDFSQKSILEVTMLGDNSLNQVDFRLGGVNEDADGTGGTTLSCPSGQTFFNHPKTEDLNCSGVLAPGEDVGWLYSPLGKNSVRVGANNGKLDSEDLRQDGLLDPDDGLGGDFGYVAPNPAQQQLFDVTSGSSRTAIDFGGAQWHTFQIPLNISTANVNLWTNIRQIRISVRQAAGGASTGVIKFARIAVVGNSWLNGQAGDPQTGAGPVGGEGLAVSAVNNVDNPNYIPIFSAGGDAQQAYNDLYGGVGQAQQQAGTSSISEQALQLNFSGLSAGTTVFTKRIFTKPIDISQHHQFNFLLFGNADPNNVDTSGTKTFFVRVGSDQNFFEMRVPLTFRGWQKFTANQVNPGGGQVPDAWTLAKGVPGTVVLSTGTINFQQVSEIVAGVYSSSNTAPNQGAVWLDEIYLSQPFTRVGNAQKLQFDFEVPKWATFGMKHRYVDQNFVTPTTTITNQDNRQDSAYVNFTHLNFLPMTFSVSRVVTITPNVNVVGTGVTSNIVNQLQQGKVVQWNGNANANFIYGPYPRLSVGYIRARSEFDLLTRLDDQNTYNGAMTYTVPLGRAWLPRTIDLNYSHGLHTIRFDSLAVLETPGNFNTREYTNTYGTRMSFAPWKGSSFNPNVSFTEVHESRADFTSGAEVDSRYPKAANETVGFSSNFKIAKWLNPAVSYNVNTIENENLSVSTFVVTTSTFVFNVGQIKTVNRSATGSVTLPLNVVDIVPKTKLFRSLNIANSYQLQDGDVWNNVESGLSTRLALWIRTPLRPSSPAAQLTTLTARDTYSSSLRWSPLEAYDIKGRLEGLRTLAVSNNYVVSVQRTDNTGTLARTISTTLPDLVASLSRLERLFYADRWLSNGQTNIKYSAHDVLTVGTNRNDDDSLGVDLRGIINKRFDTTISYNMRDNSTRDLIQGVVTQSTHHEDATVQTTFDVRRVRFTPKMDYSLDKTTQGNGVVTQDLTTVTPSLLTRADLSLPSGLILPFMKKPLLFTNRIIWTSTLSLGFRSSPVTAADNSRLLNFSTSADYELAKNLRMTLNGAFQRQWESFLKEQEYISYQFGTTFTLQF